MQSCIRLLVLALVFSFPVVSVAGTPSTPSQPGTSSSLTPSAPGVVYVKLRAGSTVFGAAATKGSQIQSTGTGKFDRTLKALKMRLVVPFDADAPKDEITREYGIDRMFCIYYDNRSVDPHAALQMLLATGEVECGSPRYLFPLSKKTNDPQLNSQWGLTNINVFSAWDVTTGDPSVIVADVDDGFNTKHEDLKNAITAGWDLVGAVSTASGAAFQPDNDPTPDNTQNSHGSHTAGCIAATGDNNLGIAGVAYGCKILAIKAAGSDADNTGGISAGYEGIHYATTHGAKVINCSWGGPISGSSAGFANTVLAEATARNVLVVASAGNGTPTGLDLAKNPQYPATGPGVLSVGASDQSDGPASFSYFGHPVSVWAPGTGILSCSYPGNTSYNAEDGTSFSSPLTAGVAALVVSMHPTWPPRFVARQIIQTCDNVVRPGDQYNYWGRVNAGSALTSPSGPGLMIMSYTLDGVASDSLGAVGKVSDLKVTFKNVVSTGSNLTATILTRTGYTAGATPTVTIGSMVVDASFQADFQITRTGTYSEGNMPVRFYVTDGANYSDTLDLLLPLKRTPGFVLERPAPFGQSIKRVSNTAAWATFGFAQTGFVTVSQYAREGKGVWSDTTTLSDGLAAAYDVEAIDSVSAYFGTGSNSVAEVIFTHDGGTTFDFTDCSSFTPFVNTIHFFDANNGILIGDPITSSTAKQPWGIGVTTDAGVSWNQIPSPPMNSKVGEASWNNSATWVGDNGWFGSNSARIWHTTNRGVSWTSATTSTYLHALGIGFDDDAIHGFAVFRRVANSSGTVTGVKGIMGSADGGTTWKVVKMPAAGMTPGAVRFVPGSHTAILTSDSGIWRTADFGATWTPIGMPVTYVPMDGDLSIYSAQGTTTASFVSNGEGIATYQEVISGLNATPGSLSFGNVIVGQDSSLSTTVKNGGTSSLTINSISVSPAGSAFLNDTSSASVKTPKTLAGGASFVQIVTFRPVAAGQQSANLVFTLSDGTTLQVPLSGVGKPLGGVAQQIANGGLILNVSTNPFHGVTGIEYEIPHSEVIRLSVFDALGREVAVLANGARSEGSYSASFDARNLPAGAYYVTLLTESGLRMNKAITLLR